MTQALTFSISHQTTYRYSDPVNLAYNEAKLLPRSFEHPLVSQHCKDVTLRIDPEPQDKQQRTDSFGNQVTYFSYVSSHDHMDVRSLSIVTRTPHVSKEDVAHYLRQHLKQPWQDAARHYPEPKIKQFVLNSQLVPFLPSLQAYARVSFEKHRGLFDALFDLMTRIFDDFTFKPGVTTVTTPLDEVARSMTGVCQDYSHFMIACVRSMGLACRYVSGYLETLPPPGEEKLQGVDASHAWVSVFIPGFGWLDFDPTNNLLPLEQHITVAWGRDYADVAPLKGVVYSNGTHDLQVAVDMARQDTP